MVIVALITLKTCKEAKSELEALSEWLSQSPAGEAYDLTSLDLAINLIEDEIRRFERGL